MRLTPRTPDAAPLTFHFTDFPGVLLNAGALHEFGFPVCGCDACDDEWTALADCLESTVLSVVGGRFEESVSGGEEDAVGYRLEVLGGLGSSSGWSRTFGAEQTTLQGERLTAPWKRIWSAWPRRGTDRIDAVEA